LVGSALFGSTKTYILFSSRLRVTSVAENFAQIIIARRARWRLFGSDRQLFIMINYRGPYRCATDKLLCVFYSIVANKTGNNKEINREISNQAGKQNATLTLNFSEGAIIRAFWRRCCACLQTPISTKFH
jgi:hypothetical protein